MLVLKLFTLLLTAVVAVVAFRHLQALWAEISPARVKAKARARTQGTRLRQDPRTGIYYPEK